MEGEDDSSSEAGSDEELDLRDIRMLLGMPGRGAGGAEDVPREVLMRQLFAMAMMDRRHQPDRHSSPQEWNDQLVSALEKSTRLQSANVIAAFRAVDRGDFVPPEHREQAYHDRPFRETITRNSGQAVLHMSQPGMYAQAVDSLMIRPCDSILNVGSGSGYLSMIFAFLVRHLPDGTVCISILAAGLGATTCMAVAGFADSTEHVCRHVQPAGWTIWMCAWRRDTRGHG